MACVCSSAAEEGEQVEIPTKNSAFKLTAGDEIWPKDYKTNYSVNVKEKLKVTFYSNKRPVDGMVNLYSFKTSNKNIATVKTKTAGNADAVGQVEITGVSAGTATITAYVKGGFAGGHKGEIYAQTEIYVTVKDSGSTPEPGPEPQPSPKTPKITSSASSVYVAPGGNQSIKVTVNLDPSQYDHITATAAKDSCFTGIWEDWVDDYSVYMTIQGNTLGSNDLTFSIEGTENNGQKVLASTVVKVVVTDKANNTIKASGVKKTQASKAQSFNLKASAGDGAALKYKSNSNSVKVNSKGKVTIAKNFCGIAKITITSGETKKYIPTSKTVKVTVKPKKTKLKVPVHKTKKLKATWTKVPNISGYHLKPTVGTITNQYLYMKSAKEMNLNITGFKKGTKYTIRIRPFVESDGERVYGAWTKVSGKLK